MKEAPTVVLWYLLHSPVLIRMRLPKEWNGSKKKIRSTGLCLIFQSIRQMLEETMMQTWSASTASQAKAALDIFWRQNLVSTFRRKCGKQWDMQRKPFPIILTKSLCRKKFSSCSRRPSKMSKNRTVLSVFISSRQDQSLHRLLLPAMAVWSLQKLPVTVVWMR